MSIFPHRSDKEVENPADSSFKQNRTWLENQETSPSFLSQSAADKAFQYLGSWIL